MGQKPSKKLPPSTIVTKTRLDALSLLPDDLVWQCRNAVDKKSRGGWDYAGNEDIGYLTKEFPPNSEEYNKVVQLFNQLGGESLPIKSIHGVYNPLLVTEFSTNRKLMEEKVKSEPWTTSWKEDDVNGLRAKVHTEYLRKANNCSWNKDLNVPVLPVVHGTGYSIAKAISKTGFAALSSLDSGYFGKGIYFTSSAKYALPYAALKEDPAIIISYVAPGNVYPTCEQHKGPESLAGKPLRTPGYNSHYVLTKKDGFALANPSENPFYDEIVVAEEAQVAPAFIIELQPGSELKEQQRLFERDVIEP